MIVRLFSTGYQQAVEAAIQDGEKSAGETGEEVEQGGSFQGTKARVCDGSLTNLITLTRKCKGSNEENVEIYEEVCGRYVQVPRGSVPTFRGDGNTRGFR